MHGGVLGCVALVAVAIAMAAASVADAQMTVGPVQTIAGTTTIAGLACPGPEACYAVGSGEGTGGGAPAPGALVAVHDGLAEPVPGFTSGATLTGIACTTVTACLASGFGATGGALVPVAGGILGSPQTAAPGANLSAIGCRPGGDCVAVGATPGINAVGEVVSVVNGSAQTVRQAPDARALNGVACPSAGTCLAVGYNRASEGVLVAIDGAVPAAARVLPTVLFFFAVACPTQTTCIAVGRGYSGDGVVVTVQDGIVGAVQDVPGTQSLTGVACADATTCVAVGGIPQTSAPSASVVVPIVAGIVGSALAVSGTSYGQMDAIACATALKCVAGGSTPVLSGVGDVVPILLAGPLATPAAQIGTPSGSTYALHDPAAPKFAFSCRAAFAGALATPDGCTGRVGGTPVADGQAIDTSHAGTFTLEVTATQADGQHVTASTSYTVAKGFDAIAFPQLGPFPFRHAAVALAATARSSLDVGYRVLSGRCTVSDATLTLITTGACVVAAQTAGDGDYDPASAVSTILVEPPTPPLCAGLSLAIASGTVATLALGCAPAAGDGAQALRYSIATLPAHGTLTALDPVTGEVRYTPVGDYEGADTFTFTATDAQGEATPAAVAITVATPPAGVSAPAVTGSARRGGTLTCAHGTWTGTAPLAYAYRWTRDGAVVAGRSTATYAVGVADGGRRIACAVTASNAVGSANASSAAVAVAPATFKLGKRAADARGSLTIRLVTGDGGRVHAVATLAARAGVRAQAYGSTSIRVAKAGAVRLHLRPGPGARRALRAHRQLRVAVAITFTPPHGRPTTKRAGLTVRGAVRATAPRGAPPRGAARRVATRGPRPATPLVARGRA